MELLRYAERKSDREPLKRFPVTFFVCSSSAGWCCGSIQGEDVYKRQAQIIYNLLEAAGMLDKLPDVK